MRPRPLNPKLFRERPVQQHPQHGGRRYGVSIVPEMAIDKRQACRYVRIADGQATRTIGAVVLHGRSSRCHLLLAARVADMTMNADDVKLCGHRYDSIANKSATRATAVKKSVEDEQRRWFAWPDHPQCDVTAGLALVYGHLGTMDTPIPAPTMLRMLLNWPLSKIIWGLSRARSHAAMAGPGSQCHPGEEGKVRREDP